MRFRFSAILVAALCGSSCTAPPPAPPAAAAVESTDVLKIESGFVDANGVLIYYEALGHGQPLLILHGGPGASHDYFLPYLLPLARTNRVVFIDERGSGKSEKLEDPKGYTVENMVEDVEAVRQHLNLGKMNLLGHSYGGVLAEAYALKYQANLAHLILGSTFHSTKALNEVFRQMKAHMTPELRNRIDAMEKAGLFGHGRAYEKGRYTTDYMVAAWGEGYFPYVYRRRPDPGTTPRTRPGWPGISTARCGALTASSSSTAISSRWSTPAGCRRSPFRRSSPSATTIRWRRRSRKRCTR